MHRRTRLLMFAALLAGCAAEVPTGPIAPDEAVPCDEDSRILSRASEDGQLVALVTGRDGTSSVLVAGLPDNLSALSVESVELYADGGSVDVSMTDGTVIHFDGSFAAAERAESGERTGTITDGLASLDLFQADSKPIESFLFRRCE